MGGSTLHKLHPSYWYVLKNERPVQSQPPTHCKPRKIWDLVLYTPGNKGLVVLISSLTHLVTAAIVSYCVQPLSECLAMATNAGHNDNAAQITLCSNTPLSQYHHRPFNPTCSTAFQGAHLKWATSPRNSFMGIMTENHPFQIEKRWVQSILLCLYYWRVLSLRF